MNCEEKEQVLDGECEWWPQVFYYGLSFAFVLVVQEF